MRKGNVHKWRHHKLSISRPPGPCLTFLLLPDSSKMSIFQPLPNDDVIYRRSHIVRWRRGGETCRGGNFGVDFRFEFRSIKRMKQVIIGNQALPLRNFFSIELCFYYSFITSNFEFISLEFKFLASSHSVPIIHVCIRFLEQPAMAVTWRVFLFFLSWKFLPKTLLTSRYK